MAWYPLRRGVADLYRRAEISKAANERYLTALAAASVITPLAQEAAKVCQPTRRDQRRHRALNPFQAADAQLLAAVNRGEWALKGFRNREIRVLLFGEPKDAKQQRSQAAKVSRRLTLLHAHGLIAKVSHTYRWQVTARGRRILTALLAARQAIPINSSLWPHENSSQPANNLDYSSTERKDGAKGLLLYILCVLCGCSFSFHPHGRVVAEPDPVGIVGGYVRGQWDIGRDGQGAGAPFVDFAMRVAKGKAARVVMIVGREIHPHGDGGADAEGAVVDAALALVQGEKDLGGADPGEVGRAAKRGIRLVVAVVAMAI